MVSTPTRVGVVGANARFGSAKDSHIPALRALLNFPLAAVATRNEDRAREAAKAFGARASFGNTTQTVRLVALHALVLKGMRSHIMKCKLKIAAVVLMLGTATAATAQTPTQTHPFVERFRQMQLLVSGNAGLKTPPVFRDTADAPVGNESFAERFASMQRAAGYPFAFDAPPSATTQAADPVGNESFSERFREMQAASSNSSQFGFQPGADELASEANSTLVVATPLRGVTRR